VDLESIRAYCLAKPGTSEDFPFDADTLVIRVKGKIFIFLPLERVPASISLKGDPVENETLREQYEGIAGAYHLNKKYWNSLDLESGLPNSLITRLIDQSYALVAAGLPKSVRSELGL
jgi:predicted DNA-binding protein (MmcQ/YjbR family)